MNKQIKVDSHNHTVCSHDARSLIEELCQSAIDKGLEGIVISDHCDILEDNTGNSFDHIYRSVEDAHRMADSLGGRLTVLAGVEMGESVWNLKAARFTDRMELDVILSSVHCVRYKDMWQSFSTIDFSAWSHEELDRYMVQYFKDMKEMVENADMDVLTHLNNPIKYMNIKYGHRVSLAPYMEQVEDILKTVIKRKIALELNTAQVGSPLKLLMPERDVLTLYKGLGGDRVTVGSDSHRVGDVGRYFDYALGVLKDCGFNSYVYYKNRRPVFVDIK